MLTVNHTAGYPVIPAHKNVGKGLQMVERDRDNKYRRKEIDSLVGVQITRARLVRNISKDQLSSSINIRTNDLASYENGECRIPSDIILKLSELFKVKPSFFFEDASDETN